MEGYGLDEAVDDLDALEAGDLDGEQRASCINRLRGFLGDLWLRVINAEQAGVVIDTDF